MPARPKPGIGQGRRPNISLGGLGGALAGVPGAPDSSGGDSGDSSSSIPGAVEGPESGSGEGSVSSDKASPLARMGGNPSPVVAKPTGWQMFLNPQLGNIYYQGQNQRANTALEGQNTLGAIAATGGQQRLTGSAATDNAIREAQNKHVIDVASQFNIPAERVPEFQAAMYPGAKSTALAQQGTQQNIAGAQQQATGTPKYANSVGIGMNANAQMDAGKLANLTKQEAGPGQSSSMFGDLASAPFSLKGPSSTSNSSAVSTRGPASSQYPNGIPMGGSATVTGQQFGGGSSSMPSLGDTSGGDAYSDYLAATGGTNSASTPQPAPVPTQPPANQQGQSSPIATKPPTNPLPGGSLGNSGGISSLLQWILSKGGNGGQFTPPSGAGY